MADIPIKAVEHSHSKAGSYTIQEKMDMGLLREEINLQTNVISILWMKYQKSHNSGFYSCEMLKTMDKINHHMAVLNSLLEDLGQIEHYNYEWVLVDHERFPMPSLQPHVD